jgi:hypothetical protein
LKSIYCPKYSKTGIAFLLLDSFILTFSTSSRVPSIPDVEVNSSSRNFSESSSTSGREMSPALRSFYSWSY